MIFWVNVKVRIVLSLWRIITWVIWQYVLRIFPSHWVKLWCLTTWLLNSPVLRFLYLPEVSFSSLFLQPSSKDCYLRTIWEANSWNKSIISIIITICGGGDWTQSLARTSQAFYHWACPQQDWVLEVKCLRVLCHANWLEDSNPCG
jgi:hypothetical protein